MVALFFLLLGKALKLDLGDAVHRLHSSSVEVGGPGEITILNHLATETSHLLIVLELVCVGGLQRTLGIALNLADFDFEPNCAANFRIFLHVRLLKKFFDVIAAIMPRITNLKPSGLITAHGLEARVKMGLILLVIDDDHVGDLAPFVEATELAIIVARLMLVVDRVARLRQLAFTLNSRHDL